MLYLFHLPSTTWYVTFSASSPEFFSHKITQGASGTCVSEQETEQKSLTKKLWNNQTELYKQELPYRQENHCSFI